MLLTLIDLYEVNIEKFKNPRFKKENIWKGMADEIENFQYLCRVDFLP